MRIIAAPRGGGKTDEAIKLAAETRGVLVVPSTLQADQVASRARKLGYSIQRPLTVDQLRQGMGKGLRGGFILDGVETLFNIVFPGLEFEAFTVCE